MDTNNMNNDMNQMNGGQIGGAPEMQQVPPQYEQAPQQQAQQQQVPPQQIPPMQSYQSYQPAQDVSAAYGGPVTVNNYGYMPQEMTVGGWMLTLFLTCIPIVNLIMLIIWAVSSGPDFKSRKNWAIAQLIWTAIGIVLSILLTVVFGASLFSMLGSGAEFYGY